MAAQPRSRTEAVVGPTRRPDHGGLVWLLLDRVRWSGVVVVGVVGVVRCAEGMNPSQGSFLSGHRNFAATPSLQTWGGSVFVASGGGR